MESPYPPGTLTIPPVYVPVPGPQGPPGPAAPTPAPEIDDALLLIGNSVDVIPTGVAGCWSFDFLATITGWYIQEFEGTSGSIVLALGKAPRSTSPSFTSVVASAPPTLSSARYAEDTTLTGWTTSVARGDLVRVSVTSASTVKRILFGLRIQRLEP